MSEKQDLPADGNKTPFNTRRSAVRKWAHELPMANLVELSRRLQEALKSVNLQRTSTRRLFYFLETIGPAASLVLADLQRQYASQPLPLNDSGTRAAHLTVELVSQILRGYRTVLRAIVPDKEEPSRLRLMWYRRELVTTLHRFIRYGDRLLETYRLLHMDPPEKVWKRINRCYLLAEAHRITTRRVPRCNEKTVKTSVAHEYKRLILSSLLPAGALPAQQQREIADMLDRWAKRVELRSPSAEGNNSHYALRIARDTGPLDLSELSAEAMKSRNTRLLDTRPLCAQLTQLRERGGKGRWWRREKEVDPALLTFLHEHWCLAHHRSETRESVNIPAEFAIGLGALFHLAGGSLSREKREENPNEITIQGLPDNGGHWHGKRKQSDVWEGIYPDAGKPNVIASPRSRAPQAAIEASYCAVQGRILDKSEHGLAFMLERDALHQAAIGMPAAVRAVGEQDWQIGTIMRIKNRGSAVELGVRILLHGIIPARLRVREGARVSPPFDVVIGRTHDLQRGIAAPTVSALRSGEPELEIGGVTLAARRDIELAHSRYMDAFIVDVSDSGALAKAEEKVRATLAQRQKTAQAEAAKTAPSAPTRVTTTQATMAMATPNASPAAQLSREERIAQLVKETGVSLVDAEFIVDGESHEGDAPRRLRSDR